MTCFGRATFSASTTSTNLPVCSVPMAVSGTSNTVLRRCSRHLDARKHAGREGRVRIGEYRAGADGAGGAIDGVVDEVQPALVRIRLFIDKLQLDRHGQAAVGRVSIFLGGRARIAQIGGLIQGELEANGINQFDSRKQAGVSRRSTRDEIANGHAAVANAAREPGRAAR